MLQSKNRKKNCIGICQKITLCRDVAATWDKTNIDHFLNASGPGG